MGGAEKEYTIWYAGTGDESRIPGQGEAPPGS
jgi:hypothetical protein